MLTSAAYPSVIPTLCHTLEDDPNALPPSSATPTPRRRSPATSTSAQTLHFTLKPVEPLTREEKKAWIAMQKGVTVGSDAFFPFGDNVERARKSGVDFIVEPGGSIRDDNVIETADRYGIAMAFTGMRLFHH